MYIGWLIAGCKKLCSARNYAKVKEAMEDKNCVSKKSSSGIWRKQASRMIPVRRCSPESQMARIVEEGHVSRRRAAPARISACTCSTTHVTCSSLRCHVFKFSDSRQMASHLYKLDKFSHQKDPPKWPCACTGFFFVMKLLWGFGLNGRVFESRHHNSVYSNIRKESFSSGPTEAGLSSCHVGFGPTCSFILSLP